MAYTCNNCGAAADSPGHLCDPVVEKLSCSFCGEDDVPVNHVCRQKLEAIRYSCDSCGRVAADSGDLCKPKDII